MSGNKSASADAGHTPKPSPRSALRSTVAIGVAAAGDTRQIKHRAARSETIGRKVSFLLETVQIWGRYARQRGVICSDTGSGSPWAPWRSLLWGWWVSPWWAVG